MRNLHDVFSTLGSSYDPFPDIPHNMVASPRLRFQWRYFLLTPRTTPPSVLNVGCSDDPLGFKEGAHHFDMDDWSARHTYFTQGDAHELPFENKSFPTVICGDVLEHVLDPMKVAEECARVAKNLVVFTIFEEWKLPDYGQFIEEGQRNSDIESRRLGYEDREDYQRKLFPDRVGVDDTEHPHLIHINQFRDQDIYNMVANLAGAGFLVIEYLKAYEATRVEDGHPFFNWLISMRRRPGGAE